uniref:DinG family ATP-dependent helicase YoaA n=1 Tax=Klebsiella pneumoniae TaxID=573 RepID=A0A8B0SUN1_KLEPN|nr:DinG family ATP-dependent helicase YoaA [Klebsiella pneumoniae]
MNQPLIAVNPFIGMNVGRYCTQWRSALLTSATLSITSTPETGMEWLCKALGLTSDTISIRKNILPRRLWLNEADHRRC